MSRSSHAVATAARGMGRLPILGLLVCSLALLVSLTGRSEAAKPPRTKVILGKTASEPDPSCPNLPCQAIGSVTGFQVDNGQTRLPFLVPHDGTIKAWTLSLAQPTNSQRTFFNGFFGTPPEARLAILHRVGGTNPPRYVLRSQGSIKVLSPYLGQTVEFGANLRVEKGDVVGLTVPTWAPAFAQELPVNNVWRASREEGACKNATDIRQGEPQQKIGTQATYGCKYTTARLLYTATLVEGG
ncbi:MAG TPA: hypothetical protein VFS64_10435 [Solirubrobacterales bacterium]|nr:hypothetical protein [Solirubrobacterales bacterium]